MLIDTHAHIHFKDYGLNVEDVLTNAAARGVERIICVGTDLETSRGAVEFAAQHSQCVATIGLHPHDASGGTAALDQLGKLVEMDKVVAIGECGLDYHYNYSPQGDQVKALRYQIELALKHKLPLIFHVREAFGEFFHVIDEYAGIHGVVHSFSATEKELEEVLSRGLLVGLNGIMTFTKESQQLAAAKAVPLAKMLLETDCPFLTPAPLRDNINEPANVKLVAEFLAQLRGESLERIARSSTANALDLFNLNN